MDWYLSALKKYAVFDGRARRKEYWMFQLFYIIFLCIAVIIDMVIGTLMVFYILYILAMAIPSISVTVRRLHDIDKSGWWYFISCVPIIGGIWLLVLVCTEGDRGINGYGYNPKEDEKL